MNYGSRQISQSSDSPYLAAIEIEKGDCLCSDDYTVQFRLEREDGSTAVVTQGYIDEL